MGDIVGSSASADTPARATELNSRFNEAIDQANRANDGTISSPLTITLGDEFQGLCRSLHSGFEVIHHLRLELLKSGIACRFALGLVTLHTPLNRDRAWNMLGEGLAETRDRLNAKKDPSAYRFVLGRQKPVSDLLDAVGEGLTDMETGWSTSQFGYVLALRDLGGDVGAVAKTRGVGVRSVYKGLHSANWDLYQRQVSAVSGFLAEQDRLAGLRDCDT
ncbi:SatD family protein [Roseibium sp. RKSG952]|uniref:SatD family protein n=1 Tax=Roseibium sp. RKSG952 TaxID=2529384 RepID=UPI0012BD0E7E|nr:SatD family protein [Roseibium sp. RKSG952]MTI00282.1 hypothetical protein [Roseibium sp. RKSG952]